MTYPNRPRPYGDLQSIGTPAAYAILVFTGGLGAFYSLFAGMATASCSGVQEQCDFDLFEPAYIVWWGGTGIALVLPAIAIWFARRAGKPMLPWPFMGFALLIGSIWLALTMMETAIPYT